LRNTIQNDMIYNIIINSDKHYSAEEIYTECLKIKSDISLGTVYRNLNKLVEFNKIRRIKMSDNVDRFDKNIIHSHAICNTCGCIIDIFYDFIKELPIVSDFYVNNYDLVFNGICKKCQEEEK